MKITFIIPVYNCKAYLPACVDSIRTVGAADYEILLIDDGSTDGSGTVCDELAQRFPEIRVAHQENAGVSTARNNGISLAQGDYILFVDADDTLQPFDANVFAALESDIDMLMYGMAFRYYHKGQYVREEKMAVDRILSGGLDDLSEFFAELFYKNYFAPVWNKFVKRSLLVEHDIRFDTRLTNYEDLAFTLQVLSKCKHFTALPDIYYLYQVDYDHDKTVDRIAKINDLLGNTDIIAETFVQVEEAILAAGGEKTDAIKSCLRNIYFELFGVKMKTVELGAIKRYCRDFVNDRHVKACVECVGIESGNQERMYRWIQQENSRAIWLRTRYSMLRQFAARNIKRITGWRLS